ncbi:putative phospholipase D (PLD) [Magnetospirillum sp. XM-1]|uniref:phospholipase D family nuclease n=1 Tax=Magnetospirillum sp. XM-1 TaxID=1663591 RepID=UPI00073DCF3C|nr:phospholipase D family protein [Magnetospirillum sp. XM-1]CUW37138.1 putative phospholipase D (PLD) [Magnetospirillum sp. XM-1]
MRMIGATLAAMLCCSVAVEGAEIRSCFTPGEDCTGVIAAEIAASQHEVLVQAYSFTSPEIVRALLDAKKRGADVRVILDKSNACSDSGNCEKKGAIAAETLALAKVPVLVDRRHAIAHNKVMVLDGNRVITGSFNFTRAAQDKNAENLLVIADGGLARRYRENWLAHAQHSVVP